MKKFVYLYYGQGEESAEAMAAWHAWFGRVGPSLVDSGNPFGGGRAVMKDGSSELTPELNPATGYSIVNAENIEEAEALLEGCPIEKAVLIYEALPM